MKKVPIILLALMFCLMGCSSDKVKDITKSSTEVMPPTEETDNNDDVSNKSDEESKENNGDQESEEEVSSIGLLDVEEDWLKIRTYNSTSDYYFNVKDAIEGKTTIITEDEIVEKYVKTYYVSASYMPYKLSSDGEKLLLLKNWDSKVIYDLVNGEVNKKFELDALSPSDDLQIFMRSYHSQVRDKPVIEIIDLETDNHRIMDSIPSSDFTIYSPSNRYIAYDKLVDDSYYLYISDLEKDEIVEKIYLGEDDEDYRIELWLTQWHMNNEIYYNFQHNAYKYNFETKEIADLGQYMFFPFLTSDEKYIIYSKGDEDPSEVSTDRIEDFGERGIFAKNVETGEVIKILEDNPYNDGINELDQLITTKMPFGQ